MKIKRKGFKLFIKLKQKQYWDVYLHLVSLGDDNYICQQDIENARDILLEARRKIGNWDGGKN